MSMPLHLILLAGGQGLRAGQPGHPPKPFRLTGRGPLFAVSLRAFCGSPAGQSWQPASVTITVPPAWRETVSAELSSLTVPWQLAEPGASRTASTWHAIEALTAAVAPGPQDLVAVHDTARPFASAALLAAVASQALVAGGAIPGVPVPDTIVQATTVGASYLPREQLVAVQTPQVFRWGIFAAAHRWAHETGREFTDDGGLLAARGHRPAVVAGDPANWKVTSAADWIRAEDLLR
jgi:2-C-methyl-D-erythritol 4-phosphate cytidylyltransferase/2-C-methyl-D-erythritol 2,4-cyclodiphosphate synthase